MSSTLAAHVAPFLRPRPALLWPPAPPTRHPFAAVLVHILRLELPGLRLRRERPVRGPALPTRSPALARSPNELRFARTSSIIVATEIRHATDTRQRTARSPPSTTSPNAPPPPTRAAAAAAALTSACSRPRDNTRVVVVAAEIGHTSNARHLRARGWRGTTPAPGRALHPTALALDLR